ncbi:MAG: undecaprenyl-diphosphate phosphatase [Thioalkalivibrio sp.]|nr:undecaprenyl-diphosphate phosphatase [Thioalkalivibrio sp.]
MDWLQVWVLALVQGLTEFLPISSAAHLILVPVLTAWEDQGLAFDVAIHVGTLAAIVAYFRRELIVVTRAWFRQVGGRGATPESMLAWAVLFGTLPAALAGLAFAGVIENSLRSPLVIATTTIGFALLLWLADWRGRGTRDEFSIRWRDIAIVGGAQALALIPGTSRSGITMTAALLLGFSRKAAARYSFLLAIPIIALAGAYETLKLVQSPPDQVHWAQLFTGAVIAGLAAWLCVHWFLKLIERIGMLPFIVYRLILGAFLLWVFL